MIRPKGKTTKRNETRNYEEGGGNGRDVQKMGDIFWNIREGAFASGEGIGQGSRILGSRTEANGTNG